jgi:UDP-glucuronate decarboxylase
LLLTAGGTSSRRNLSHLVDNPRFEAIRHDICFPLYVEVDRIYNLACPASPIHYQHDPVQTTKTSVHGAINTLGLAKRVHVRILQASTSEVYGDPLIHPQNESYWGHVNPIGPRACYDEGKRCAETLFFDYHRQHRVEIKVARIFNTYGPRMQLSDGRVVSNFIVRALKQEPLTTCDDGMQTRSFCYVDDLIRALVAFVESDAALTDPLNFGNPMESTMLELAEHVLRLTSSHSELVFVPLPPDDPKQRCPDITLAQRHLDWSPEVTLEDGLKETIAYFRRELGPMKLSVVIPCYNEKDTLETLVQRVRQAPYQPKEIIVVDDGSDDGTEELLRKGGVQGIDRVIFQERNQGKGAALRAGIKAATGEVVIVQDADLEYDPREYGILIQPILAGHADVVFGSRFLGAGPHRVLYFWHRLGNGVLTLVSNMLTNLNLTDMETCYKMFRREIIQAVTIEENRFGFEPEITAKIARMGVRIYEVGISYHGRTYAEGKKINWKDGFGALYCIVKYNLFR